MLAGARVFVGSDECLPGAVAEMGDLASVVWRFAQSKDDSPNRNLRIEGVRGRFAWMIRERMSAVDLWRYTDAFGVLHPPETDDSGVPFAWTKEANARLRLQAAIPGGLAAAEIVLRPSLAPDDRPWAAQPGTNTAFVDTRHGASRVTIPFDRMSANQSEVEVVLASVLFQSASPNDERKLGLPLEAVTLLSYGDSDLEGSGIVQTIVGSHT